MSDLESGHVAALLRSTPARLQTAKRQITAVSFRGMLGEPGDVSSAPGSGPPDEAGER